MDSMYRSVEAASRQRPLQQLRSLRFTVVDSSTCVMVPVSNWHQWGVAMVQAEGSVDNAGDEATVAGVLRGGVFVSLEELTVRARRAATGLRSLGVEQGGAVALLLRNDHEFFEAAFAAAALGAATVPINWHGSAEEVAYVATDSKAEIGRAD